MNALDVFVYPLEPFGDAFQSHYEFGVDKFRTSSVAFVGLARNCAGWLSDNLTRLELLGGACAEWRLHIETNDNTDNTDQVLIDFCRDRPHATFTSQRLDRKQFTAEFAGPRTLAFAEYRDACQRWVAANAFGCDYVVVIDFDAWGGWSHAGFMVGVSELEHHPDAYGMASVSLMQHPQPTVDDKGQLGMTPLWQHYDAWALRLNSYWDDYTANMGGWKHSWLPPVGSPALRVCSAFGGMAIYRTADYLKGTYDGTTDCEHVSFHASVANATGRHLYLCPSMRTVMYWAEDAKHRIHGV